MKECDIQNKEFNYWEKELIEIFKDKHWDWVI